MIEINETGGAFIGNGRASKPFARLTVNKYMLQLNAGIIGNLVFRNSDIISITPYTGGISINHRVDQYKKKVCFVTSDPAELIEQIRQTGLPTNNAPIPPETEQYISTMQASGVYPIKTSAIVAIVVIWNIFFIPTVYSSIIKGAPEFHSIGPRLSLGFMFMVCLSLLISPQMRHLVLKEGRTMDGIKTSLYFIMFITGVMFATLSLVPIAG